MNTALQAFIYADFTTDAALKQRYHDFAVRQVDYALGDNPDKHSFVIGFGVNPPTKPHHRSAHGSWSDAMTVPEESRHVLYGALVGGPGKDDKYTDSRQDYVMNEVATDYNAAFTGALARMYQEYGGSPLANFPAPEAKDTEFAVSAKVNASGPGFTEISARLMNKTAWPARMGANLKIRYFLDLTETFAAGYALSDITVSLNFNQDNSVKSATLKTADAARHLYYVELDFTGAKIYPGGQSQFSKEVQFRMALPAESKAGAWDPTNDPSYAGLAGSSAAMGTDKIPVYEGWTRVAGSEPAGITAIQAVPRGRNSTWRFSGKDLTFTWPKDRLYTLSVRTSDGRIAAWAQKRSATGSERVRLEALPPGVYLVSLQGDGVARAEGKITLLP
jgi:hypothetical protein